MKNPQQALRKAAIVVASLPRDEAQRLLEQMPDSQADLVRGMLAELHVIDPEEQEAALVEFLRVSPLVPRQPPSGIELDDGLRRRLAPAAPSARDAAPPFGFLQGTAEETLAPLLRGERPQTIALVLAHLPPSRSAAVLSTLSATQQAMVIRCLVDLDETAPEILEEVQRGLESRVQQLLRAEHRRAAGLTAVSKILDAADPRLRRSMVANLARHDQPLSARLVPPVAFEFADFEQLDDRTLLTVFAAADPACVVLALVGASAALADRVAALLPPHEAQRIRQSLASPGPTRLSDVEQAQVEIAALARRLHSEGRIDLPPRVAGAVPLCRTA